MPRELRQQMNVPKGEISKADEEEAFCPPLREIELERARRVNALGDDDSTRPSELATLRTASTLTPPTYDPDLNLGFRFSPTSSESTYGISQSRRAFQLASLIGLLFMGVTFGADLVFMYSGKDRSNINLLHLPRESDTPQGHDKEHKVVKTRKNKAGKQIEKQNVNDDKLGESTFSDAHDIIIATTHGVMPEEPPRVTTPHMISTIIDEWNSNTNQDVDVAIPEAHKRCPYVMETFEEQNRDTTDMTFLRKKYIAQSVDPNVFYRATARLFWKDFGAGHWGREQNKSINLHDLVLLRSVKYDDGSPLSPKSTETWITGDQHLSNFGAWLNRGGDIVFSVNDFDEGAIFDFHLDVLRLAVSISNHGFTNGLTAQEVEEALEEFAFTYSKAVIDYVGGDKELEYEITEATSVGILRDFLADVGKKPQMKMTNKFTELGSDGARRFVRNKKTRLEDLSPDIEEKIRAEMTSTKYGSTMTKMGWKVHGWDDNAFEVLDVARRTGSGVGSFGVDRFYVLLKGYNTPIILDVKFEPESAIASILDEIGPEEKAWYDTLFRNEADRAAKAQRSLTSYTDPYVGYLVIDGLSYSVRERSPYKTEFDLDLLTEPRDFNEFIEQVAIATATAHVRGTVSKSPGQFKHVIKLLLSGGQRRSRWVALVVKIALSYRHQVLLDFECFKQYVETFFSADI